MKTPKIICGAVCFLLFAAQVWSMSHWSEARGVYDDICYLRQAHLFQRFGFAGLDTDISRDDDGYLARKLKEINFPPNAPPPCHTAMPASNKLVMQYPPGTGFLLALFPDGHQVIPLFVLATTIMFGIALLAIFYAGSTEATLLAMGLGGLAIYIMVNPVEASYSMAPTNAINAGSPFATTYGGQDVAAPALSLDIVWQYVADMQFVLLVLAALSAGYFLRASVDNGIRRVALIAAVNLAVNVAFFFTHTAITPYYTIPIAMLSLWSMAFAALTRPAEAVDGSPVGQAASARS